jgi:hypothetical protein
VPPTTARRISKRLLTSLQSYDPQVLSVEFDALFKPIAPRVTESTSGVGGMTMKGVTRSFRLFQAFRNEGTDPATFYRLLAEDTVEDVSRYCQLVGAMVLDVGGASGYVADVFREVGANSVTAEYNFDQMVEHGRRLVNGVAADGAALPLTTGIGRCQLLIERAGTRGPSHAHALGDGAGGVPRGCHLPDLHQLALTVGGA